MSRVLTSRKYLEGSDKKGTGLRIRGKKRKSVPSVGMMKKAKTKDGDDGDKDDDDDNTTQQKVKEKPH